MTDPAPRLALLFPGQGVGGADLRELVAEHRPALLEGALELVRDDPFARFGEGTRFAQPVVYCASLAAHQRLGRPPAHLYAGHSLGEISALAAAGALDELDGLRVVVARGRLMAEAAAASTAGGMLAVGGERGQAATLAVHTGLVLANENSPSQFVLSGPDEAIEAARTAASSDGLRAKRLAVAGAFHSPAMRPAVEPFRAELDRVDFRSPRAPVISCVTAAPFDDDPRDLLAAALTSPVRWISVLERLHAEGVSEYCDVGPGRVLAGLVRRTLDGARTVAEPTRSREAAHA